MLNLEVRLFLVMLLSQFFFYAHAVARGVSASRRSFDLAAVLVFACLLLLAIGINAKMGLTSLYLKQLEAFIEANGGGGLQWERAVASTWLFVPGNAYTLAVGLSAVILLLEFFYISMWAQAHFVDSLMTRSIFCLLLTGAFAFLAVKSITVDFGRPPPSFFKSGDAFDGDPQARGWIDISETT